MKLLLSKHPIWLVGFRPFFFLAICLGAVLPILWWAVFSGQVRLPGNINPIQWHAHEMLFGFGGAVLIGFLLTASKNWVGVRGIYGWPLMMLSGLWVFERIIIYFIPNLSSLLGHFVLSIFFSVSAMYLLSTLFIYRRNDTFKDNFYFYPLLITALIAKNLLISESFYSHGVAMSIGIFRLAFAVMFERTMTQFMKGTEGVQLYRSPYLDYAIKTFVALSIFQEVLPKNLSVIVLFLAASLLLFRWFLWSPQKGFKKFGNATMYIGYMGLVIHLYLEALRLSGIAVGVGTISLHAFTFLTMGVVIPSMIIRISQGHTGRKPEFQKLDRIAIIAILIAAIFRLVLVSVYPERMYLWLFFASICWFCAFVILGYRFFPMLLRPRIDNKEH